MSANTSAYISPASTIPTLPRSNFRLVENAPAYSPSRFKGPEGGITHVRSTGKTIEPDLNLSPAKMPTATATAKPSAKNATRKNAAIVDSNSWADIEKSRAIVHRKPEAKVDLVMRADSEQDRASKSSNKKVPVTCNVRRKKADSAAKADALREQVQTLAKSVSKLQAPEPDLEGVAAHHVLLRKMKILQVLNIKFGERLPVLDVQLDDQGRLARIKVPRAGIRNGRKWIDIDWNNDLPQFAATPKRLQNQLNAAKLGEKWKGFAVSLEDYDSATRIQADSANSALRLKRAAQAWSQAAELIQHVKPDESYLRSDLQAMKYTITDSDKFREAYESASLQNYFKGMDEAEKGEHIPGLLVESFRDSFQMMAGRFSMDELLELVRLFPESPDFGDTTRTDVEVENKDAIRKKLKERLGEHYQLIGTMFQLSSAFFDLACHQLETPSLKGLPKTCWGTYLCFFGFSNVQFDTRLRTIPNDPGSASSVERKKLGKQIATLASQLANNAPDYFDLKTS